MEGNGPELAKLACLKMCDRYESLMSHYYPTAITGIVPPQLTGGVNRRC
jgi:hypothetical protein